MNSRPSRCLCLMMFVAVSLLHHITLGDADGFIYYASAAFFDLVVIFLLSRITVIHVHVLFMQVICLLFIIANCAGWVMWYLYMPPTYYNLACYALYIAAILILLKRGGNGRNTTVNQLRSCVNFNRLQGGFNHLKDKGTA